LYEAALALVSLFVNTRAAQNRLLARAAPFRATTAREWFSCNTHSYLRNDVLSNVGRHSRDNDA
jgi:hypothetical protein